MLSDERDKHIQMVSPHIIIKRSSAGVTREQEATRYRRNGTRPIP